MHIRFKKNLKRENFIYQNSTFSLEPGLSPSTFGSSTTVLLWGVSTSSSSSPYNVLAMYLTPSNQMTIIFRWYYCFRKKTEVTGKVLLLSGYTKRPILFAVHTIKPRYINTFLSSKNKIKGIDFFIVVQFLTNLRMYWGLRLESEKVIEVYIVYRIS